MHTQYICKYSLCHKESKHFKRGKQIAASTSKQQCNMIDI